MTILYFSSKFPESQYVHQDIEDTELQEIKRIDPNQMDIERKLVGSNLRVIDASLEALIKTEFSQDWNGEQENLLTEEERLGSHV